MLDRAFRATWRNFSTYVLLIAVFTVPLHVAYGFVFRDVVEVRELHAHIEEFPEARQVRGVGPQRLQLARWTYLLLMLLELALIPFLARSARRILEIEERGGVPSVVGGLKGMTHGPGGVSAVRRGAPWPALILMLGLATAVGALFESTGLMLVEPLPNSAEWAFAGVVQGSARALGGVFVVVPLAFAARTAKEVPPGEPTL